MEALGSFGSQKKPKKYNCKYCDFITCDKKDYNRHLETNKHKLAVLEVDGSQISSQKPKKTEKNRKPYKCEFCNKSYTNSGGLWKHKQKCGVNTGARNHTIEPTSSPVGLDKDKIILDLISDNRKLAEKVVELSEKTGTTYNGNNNNNGTINNNFNLNVFLNETCKDAMNITDFIHSIKLQLQDFEKVGELGYAEGISRMFINGLNELDVTKRPIHCSDLKRETLHIKDKDKWEKDVDKSRVTRAIKDLSNKNFMLMDDWQRENPGCKEYNNHKNDLYLKMMVECLGPADEKAEHKEFNKIIRKIAKNTIIDKNEKLYVENYE